MEIYLDKRAVKQIRLSAQEAIEEDDMESLREDILEAFTEDQVEEIERRLDAGDFFEFLTDVLDEWGGDDVDEQDRPIDVRDPLASQIRARLDAAGDETEARIRAVLEVGEVFGSDLPRDPRFVHALVEAYRGLLLRGARDAVMQANL